MEIQEIQYFQDINILITLNSMTYAKELKKLFHKIEKHYIQYQIN